VILKSFELANVIKLNDAELTTLTQMFELNPHSQTAVEELARRFDLSTIAVTCGPAGSYLFQKGRWSHLRSKPIQVADTVGAGDAFNAALAVGLASGMDLGKVHLLANEAASFVCTQHGATPAMPETLVRQFSKASAHS
jgi:fructokinase